MLYTHTPIYALAVRPAVLWCRLSLISRGHAVFGFLTLVIMIASMIFSPFIPEKFRKLVLYHLNTSDLTHPN
jgi:hypothetical protein